MAISGEALARFNQTHIPQISAPTRAIVRLFGVDGNKLDQRRVPLAAEEMVARPAALALVALSLARRTCHLSHPIRVPLTLVRVVPAAGLLSIGVFP